MGAGPTDESLRRRQHDDDSRPDLVELDPGGTPDESGAQGIEMASPGRPR